MGTFTWPNKDPDEVLDYTHYWDDRIGSGGDAIFEVDAIVDSGDVVIDLTSFLGTIQTVRLSGGTAGTSVKLTLRATCVSGQIYDEGIKLKIKEF